MRNRTENNSACTFYRQRIQFARFDTMKQAGVDVELVERAEITERVPGNGEITYDQTRLANISSRAPQLNLVCGKKRRRPGRRRTLGVGGCSSHRPGREGRTHRRLGPGVSPAKDRGAAQWLGEGSRCWTTSARSGSRLRAGERPRPAGAARPLANLGLNAQLDHQDYKPGGRAPQTVGASGEKAQHRSAVSRSNLCRFGRPWMASS